MVEPSSPLRRSSVDKSDLSESVKQSSASVSTTADVKQNLDELPDDFPTWTEANWKDTNECELCTKKYSLLQKRHHWYLFCLIHFR